MINLSPRFRKKPLPPSQQSARTFEESGQSSPTLNHLNANFSLNSPPSQLPQPIANGQLPKEMSDFSRLNGKQVRQQGCTAVAEDTEVLQIHRRPYSTPIQQNGGVKRLPQLDLDDTASTTVSAPNGRIGRKSDPLTNRKLQGRQKALSTQLETIPVVDTQPILLNRIANGRRRTPFAQQNHRDKRGNSATRPFVIQPDLHCPSEDTLRNLSLEQLNRVNSVDSLSEAEFFVVAI